MTTQLTLMFSMFKHRRRSMNLLLSYDYKRCIVIHLKHTQTSCYQLSHKHRATRLTRRAGLRRSRPWYKVKRDAGPSPGLAGKNGTFSEKNDKKGSQNRVQLDHSHSEISLFFREFPGFPKIQVEMTGAGKGGEAGA